jgi:hypothetical protein
LDGLDGVDMNFQCSEKRPTYSHPLPNACEIYIAFAPLRTARLHLTP